MCFKNDNLKIKDINYRVQKLYNKCQEFKYNLIVEKKKSLDKYILYVYQINILFYFILNKIYHKINKVYNEIK